MINNEVLKVKNFGPLLNVEVTISPVTIFIGPQAAGKSTLAKLLSVLKDIGLRRNEFQNIDDIKKAFSQFNISAFIKKTTTISFETPLYTITIEKLKFSFIVHDIEKTREELHEMQRQLRIIEPDMERLEELLKVEIPDSNEVESLSKKVRKILLEFNKQQVLSVAHHILRRPLYVPAERSLISLISDSLYEFLKYKISLPEYILDFGSKYFDSRKNVQNFRIDFLNIDYSFFQDTDWINTINKKSKISLKAAASGFHAVVPLILVLINKQKNRPHIGDFFVVEEPELNLFPDAQHQLVQFIFRLGLHKENTFVFTTHSPYILSSIDNLIQADNAFQGNKKMASKIQKVLPKSIWLPFENVSAYFLTNGTAMDIKDYELKSLGSSKIDDVSEEIGQTFEKLLNIKYAE